MRSAPLDPSEFGEHLGDPGLGAHVLFVGTVRDRNSGKDVVHLEYEAYLPMAERTLSEISAEAEKRFGVRTCDIVHRHGRLSPGEVSVVVVVASEHREAAFQAVQWAVSEVKHRVPIWKKETYEDGESRWLDGQP